MDAGGADRALGEVLTSTQHIHEKWCRSTGLRIGCEAVYQPAEMHLFKGNA